MALIQPPVNLIPRYSQVIGDKLLTTGSGGVHSHIYAATGKITAEFAMAGAAEVDQAVKAARAAFPAWRAMSSDKKRDLLSALAQLIEKHGDELAKLALIDNANPMALLQYMPSYGAQQFRYCAGWADKLKGELIPAWGDSPALDYAILEPYGVVACIIPWNGPLFGAPQVMAPVLASGNCVIMKPPEIAPYTVLRLAELALEAGFPPGVVNAVPGGVAAGEALVGHPGVDKISFVGSGLTAQRVLVTAAQTIKPCCIELGGKSAVIVFDDADLEAAAGRGLAGVVFVSGQGCVNGTRLLVHKPIYEKFLAMLVAQGSQVPIGDPLQPHNLMGPLISEAAAQRVQGVIDKAVKNDGGRLVLGGQRLGGELADGYFLPLTIIADVKHESDLAQKEVFGPVLSVTPFDTEEEAIRLANGTPYGLGAYIHTRDLRRAHVVADALDAGMIRINGAHDGFTAATPFGGFKQSGYGRLGGEAGVREFLQTKNVWVNLAGDGKAGVRLRDDI